jgi:hypothetical protein
VNGILTSTYNANNSRIQLVTPSAATLYVPDAQNVLLETNAAGVTQAHYTDRPGILGGLTSQNRSGASSFYGFDLSANTRLLTGPTGAQLATYLSDAFGLELSATGGVVNFLRFGGQGGYWRDVPNEMLAGARRLSALLGEWLSRAAAEDQDEGERPYAYAQSNPVIYIRLDGLAAQVSGDARNVRYPPMKCPAVTPNDLTIWNDYAIACSEGRSNHISATFTLPAICDIPLQWDYINFYLSMGSPSGKKKSATVEAGVSFSRQNFGWVGFINGLPCPLLIHNLGPGVQVSMSLTRNQGSGDVTFEIAGNTFANYFKLGTKGQVRLVNAGHSDNDNSRTAYRCRVAHSPAIWTDISVDGRMHGWRKYHREIVTEHPPPQFSSYLRTPSWVCDGREWGLVGTW